MRTLYKRSKDQQQQTLFSNFAWLIFVCRVLQTIPAIQTFLNLTANQHLMQCFCETVPVQGKTWHETKINRYNFCWENKLALYVDVIFFGFWCEEFVFNLFNSCKQYTEEVAGKNYWANNCLVKRYSQAMMQSKTTGLSKTSVFVLSTSSSAKISQ